MVKNLINSNEEAKRIYKENGGEWTVLTEKQKSIEVILLLIIMYLMNFVLLKNIRKQETTAIFLILRI